MPEFKYRIKEPTGEESEGFVDAPDRFVAAADLRATGKTVLSVDAKNDFTIPGLEYLEGLMNHVKEHDLIIFAHSLSAMMTAGLSLSRALSILERQATNKTFKKTITTLIDEISRGQTLS